MLQVVRLVLAGALAAAALALPSIGSLLERRRLARLVAVTLASAALFLVAHYVQRASADADIVISATRLASGAVLSWAPLMVALLWETTGREPKRAVLVTMTCVCLSPWMGELVTSSTMHLSPRPIGKAVLVPEAGPLFPLIAIYGLGVCGYVGRGFYRARGQLSPAHRRLVTAIVAVGALCVANDVALVLGLAPTIAILDLGVGVAALTLVAVLQTTVGESKTALDTAVRVATSELSDARDELRSALNTTMAVLAAQPDVVLLHRDDRIVFINDAGRQWLGAGEDMHVSGLLHDDGSSGGSLRGETISAEPSAPFELRFRATDGTALLGEVVELTLDVDGVPTNMAIIRDLTERSVLERQLLTADRLASLGTLAAGVAHEINNPLTYITTNLMLARDMVDDPEVAAMIADAIEGAQRVSRIVDSLGAFARRPGAHDDDHVDVARAVSTALKLVRHELRHRAVVDVNVPTSLPRPKGVEGEVVQVLVNLLTNAAHAIDDAPERASHRISVTAAHEHEALVITVEDTGCGIPESIRDRLTDPFFTTKEVGRGTGLGLSICHGIVEGLGGSFELVNRPPNGARARVSLPVADEAPRSMATVVEEPTGPSSSDPGEDRALETRGLQVLLVDDDAMVRRSVRRMLREHEVTTAATGQDALAQCSQRQFDVIICDVMMPGMSGTEVLEHLSTVDPDQASRLILLTGGVFTPDEKARIDKLGTLVLQKPIAGDQLEEAIVATAS